MWTFKKKQPKFIRKSRKFDFTGEKARQILIMADKAFNDKRYNVDRFDLWAYIKSLIIRLERATGIDRLIKNNTIKIMTGFSVGGGKRGIRMKKTRIVNWVERKNSVV